MLELKSASKIHVIKFTILLYCLYIASISKITRKTREKSYYELLEYNQRKFKTNSYERLASNIRAHSNNAASSQRKASQFVIQYTASTGLDKNNMINILNYFNSITSIHKLLANAHEALKETLSLALRKRRKVILLDLADIENKGDMSINIGEFHLLSALNLEVVYYCPTVQEDDCLQASYDYAEQMSRDELAVLIHGGGNIGMYAPHDVLRNKILKTFHNYKIIQLSQSAYFEGNYLVEIEQTFQAHPDFSIILRDLYSFQECIWLFPKLTLYLAPDMVFNVINQKGFAPALYDYVRMKRIDGEKLSGEDRDFHIPHHYSLITQDWRPEIISPQGKDLVDWSYLAHYTGLLFLQKGKFVVTDRLHGYIMALLMHKPVFVIDNSIKKISHYIETWCMGIRQNQWDYWNFASDAQNRLPLKVHENV